MGLVYRMEFVWDWSFFGVKLFLIFFLEVGTFCKIFFFLHYFGPNFQNNFRLFKFPQIPTNVRSEMSRVRLWTFTLFDPTIDDREFLNSCADRGDLTYWCGQCERCPTTRRRHLQGFLCLSQPRTLVGVKRLMFVSEHLRTVRLAVCKGTAEQNRVYCSKLESRDDDGGFDFTEHGVFAEVPCRNGQGERTDLFRIGQAIVGGASLATIARDAPDSFIRYFRGFEQLQRVIHSQPRPYAPDAAHEPCDVHWYYGSTGSGKSREAFAQALSDPDLSYYSKPSGNRWWCGYNGQPIVILDDFRADWFTFSYLIRLIDAYPIQVEIKGGMVEMSAKIFYITCPMRPEHLFQRLNSSDDGRMAQLTRRITETRLFGEEPAPPAPFVEGFGR